MAQTAGVSREVFKSSPVFNFTQRLENRSLKRKFTPKIFHHLLTWDHMCFLRKPSFSFEDYFRLTAQNNVFVPRSPIVSLTRQLIFDWAIHKSTSLCNGQLWLIVLSQYSSLQLSLHAFRLSQTCPYSESNSYGLWQPTWHGPFLAPYPASMRSLN